MEVIWGHAFGHGEVKWPPIGLKHWKVEYWSHYLSFDMSHDMGYAKVIIVIMEVIWGHVFGHGEVKWPPIGLKHWNVEYWSHYLSFDMSLAMVWFFFDFGPQWRRGGGRAQVNRAKKTYDFTEFSKNMEKIMPNGEKKIIEISTNEVRTTPPLNQPSGTPPLSWYLITHF